MALVVGQELERNFALEKQLISAPAEFPNTSLRWCWRLQL